MINAVRAQTAWGKSGLVASMHIKEYRLSFLHHLSREDRDKGNSRLNNPCVQPTEPVVQNESCHEGRKLHSQQDVRKGERILHFSKRYLTGYLLCIDKLSLFSEKSCS